MIDSNESLDEKGSKLLPFTEETGLIDAHSIINSRLPCTTRQGSNKRIDHIFCTEVIGEYLTQGGYLAYTEGFPSDHILLWCDFDLNKFFKGQGPTIVPPKGREFRYNNTKRREEFTEHLQEQYYHQNIPTRITNLTKALASSRLTKEHIMEYNRIDRDIKQCIRCALKKTIRTNYGHARSPAITSIGTTVLTWRKILKCKINGIQFPQHIHDLAQRANIDLTAAQQMSIPQLLTTIQRVRKEQKELQSNANSLQIQWLEGAARTKAAEDDDIAQKEIQNIIKQMRCVAMHQKLTRITKGCRGGLDYIEIPTQEWYWDETNNELYHYNNGLFECHLPQEHPGSFYTHSSLKVPPQNIVEVNVQVHAEVIQITQLSDQLISWKKVTNKIELENIIVERNKKHLQQVAMEEAPPLQPKFRKLLDDYGCGPNSNKILDGELTTELESFPQIVRTWFTTLKRTKQELQCPEIDGWITREEFQTAFRKTKEKTSSSPSGINYTLWKCIASNDELSDYHATFLSLPFVYGFVNERWTHSIDVMLEKVKGLRQIHRLRIIGLVEADFNTALKIYFARKLIPNSEHTNLTEQQWARPDKTAMDPALRKMLSLEYARVMYVTLIFFANDATACFDRMVPDITTIIARKYGMKGNIMKCRNMVMEQLKRGVRTMHGDSTITYQRDFYELMMMGEVQGKADAAPAWSLESHTFLRTHQYHNKGTYLPHINNSSIAIIKNNDAYVDDDMTITEINSNFNSCAQELVPIAEHAAQDWNDIIALSGGSVAHHKSMWQGISFDNSFPPKINEYYPGEIHLSDRKGVKTKIKKQSSNFPNKGLGCYLAPTASQTGTNKHEYEVREQQALILAGKVRPHKLQPHEAHHVMSGRAFPSIGYSATLTRFNVTQTRKLNSITNETLLPKASFNRKTAHAVIYSPITLGGAAWPEFQTKQDVDSILAMLKHFRFNGTVGKDMLVVLSAWQLASGLCNPILKETDTNITYIGDGWFPHVRQRLNLFQGKLWVEHQWTPQIQRDDDIEIMRLFITNGKTTLQFLIRMNYVRLFLRVITLADLTNELGTIIPANRFTGKWQANSTLNWPQIPPPPASALSQFRNFLQRHLGSTTDGKQRKNSITLSKPLGIWHHVPRHIQHTAHRSEQHIYINNNDIYTVYTKQKHNIFSDPVLSPCIEEPTIPISYGIHNNQVSTNNPFRIKFPIKYHSTPSEQIHHDTSPPLSGSDGSVDTLDGSNATAYIVNNGKIRIEGQQRTPNTEYATSYRAELLGKYLTTKCLQKHATQTTTQVCDNKRAVEAISLPLRNPTQMLESDMDLILAIKHERNRSTFPSNLEWVKAHTDTLKPKGSRTPKEILNIKVDDASKHTRIHHEPRQPVTPYPGSGAMLMINNKWVTTRYKDQLHLAIHRPKHKKYFTNRHNLTSNQYDDILWDVIGTARRNIRYKMNARIAKYMNGWLNHGHQKGKLGKDSTCPCCGLPDETQAHIFQCTNPTVNATRLSSIKAMKTYLTENKVAIELIECVIELCNAFFHQSSPNIRHTSAITSNLIKSQLSLGLELFTRGYLTSEWITAAKHYHKQQPKAKLKHILHGLWFHILEPIWETRNTILHKSDNIVTQQAHNQANSELSDWKILSHERLHHTQLHLINYSKADFKYWTLQHKLNTLHILQLAHKNYKQYLKSETNTGIQQLITKHIHRIAPNPK